MRKDFVENYEKLLAFVVGRNMINITAFVSMYNMTIHIDYASLEKKLVFTKELIEKN
jgi:hypothetical protein